MIATCLACFSAAMGTTGHAPGGYDTRAWLSLLGLGLIVQIAGWWLNSWGIGHTDAALGAIALQGQQVATLFLATALLGEALRPLALVGATLIIAGIVMVARNRERAALPPPV
ncbi:MAG: DMT family transporter [Bacteroidota bacterium]